MDSFKLNERLEKGGIDFGSHGICRVLLKNNSHFLWFILVPEIDSSITEVHQLSIAQYNSINHSTRFISEFLSKNFAPEKINIIHTRLQFYHTNSDYSYKILFAQAREARLKKLTKILSKEILKRLSKIRMIEKITK